MTKLRGTSISSLSYATELTEQTEKLSYAQDNAQAWSSSVSSDAAALMGVEGCRKDSHPSNRKHQ